MPRVFSTQGTVSDGGGVALMTALVVPPDGILRVEPVTLLISNRPPLVASDSYTATADLELVVEAPGVLLNDSDPDGDLLSVVAFDDPSALGASVIVSAEGKLTYDPTVSALLTALLPGESLLDTFQYTACDGGNQVSATVSVLVSGAPLPVCAASDVDRDGDVDIVDIGLVTGRWSLTSADPGWEPIYDVIVNGVIDVADVAAVAGCWG